MFDAEETSLPGCLRIRPVVRADQRGIFIKTFHVEEFRRLGLPTSFAEEYFSVSHCGVLRGPHQWIMKRSFIVHRGKSWTRLLICAAVRRRMDSTSSFICARERAQ